ncbi:MAG: hypothetical protein IJV00_01470 [Clostridia bacterium]|nr:hypothetical protein [Clostridia bacterium]
MKKLAKLIPVLLCAILILASVPAFVFPAAAETDAMTKAMELIYEGILNHEAEIDISECGLSTDECKEVLTNFFDIYPYAFVADRSKTSFSYVSSTNTVTVVKPTYFYEADDAKAVIESVDKKVDAIVSKMKSSWSIPEKLLFIHDYIACNFEYDLSFQSSEIHSFFEKKKGTCNSYCMTFIALCNKINVPCVLESSQDMYHAWVRVQIDGQWYHVDVTHDDATPDKLGRVSHAQFLVSDKKISDRSFFDPHYGFETGYCTSEKYDNAFWTESTSSIVYLNGKWYYCSSEADQIKTGSFSSLSGLVVHSFDTMWSADGGYWPGCYSGLIAENGKLLYNTENEIIELDPSTGATRSIFTLSGGQIYSVFRDAQDALIYVKASNPNGENQSKNAFTVPEPPAEPTEFKIRFMSEGVEFASYTVKKEDVIPCPEDVPFKRSDDRARYEFSLWSGYSSNLRATEDRDFTAVFSEIAFTTAPQSTNAPSTTRNSTTRAPSTTAPASTQPANTAPASTAPASSAPASSSVPATSAPATSSSQPALTSTPAASSETVPGSTRDESGPNTPDASYSGDPEVTHNLPVKSSVSGSGSANGPSTTVADPEGPNKDKEPSSPAKDALPWIIAGAGGVVVVGGIIVIEKVVMPKRRMKNSSVAGTDDSDDKDNEERK